MPPGLVSKSVAPHPYLELRDDSSAPFKKTSDEILLRTLTSRDLVILMALDQYRYLDRSQIEQLFFPGPRFCQRRLRYLAQCDVVLPWQARLQPGLHPRPSVYLLSARGARLLARFCKASPAPFVRRAEHARTRAFHLMHDLEANAFFVALARASTPIVDQGLYHWVGERGCWRAYQEAHELGPIPDGWGRYLLPEGEVIFFLEWDRGTLQRARLRSKVTYYRAYFRGRRRAAATHVLYVVPSAAREDQVRTEIGRVLIRSASDSCRFWTATVDRLQNEGPLGCIWRPSGSSAELVRLAELPKHPRSSRPADACIAKPSWWERRPAGGQGA